MDIKKEFKYTKEHEWISIDNEIVTIGITDFAQGELGDIVFLEFPEIGTKTEKMKSIATIEAVKTVADLFAPCSGEVTAVNEAINDTPELINKSPYDDGWIMKIKTNSPDELNEFLSADEYQKLLVETKK